MTDHEANWLLVITAVLLVGFWFLLGWSARVLLD